MRAVLSDFTSHLGLPAEGEAPGPRLAAFLGSTIGNLVPAERASFLARLRARLSPGDFFLLGTDLVKDPATLVAAYDDGAGVTAEFNKNVLAVLNAELGADFDRDEFEHVAVWDAEAEWIEMRLRSLSDQEVHLPGIGLTVRFGRRGGDADRGVRQVPPPGRAGRTSRGRVRDADLVDGFGRAVRPLAVRPGLTGLRGLGADPCGAVPARPGRRVRA